MNVSLDVLNDAIRGRQEGLISVRDGGAMHQLGVRFTGEGNQDGVQGFWGQLVKGNGELVDWLIKAAATVEVSFNTEKSSVFFDSALLLKQRQWFRERVLLKKPEQLTIVERRKDNRELVPEDVEINAQISRAEQANGPTCDLSARVFDLSPTGASFLCRADQPLPKLEDGEPLSVRFLWSGNEHRAAAWHRHTQRLSSSTVRLGVQFDLKGAVDFTSQARFRALLEQLHSVGIRRSFRSQLRKRFHFDVN